MKVKLQYEDINSRNRIKRLGAKWRPDEKVWELDDKYKWVWTPPQESFGVVELPYDLWQHQKEALKFLIKHPRAIIWGGMGVGKTRITLEYIKLGGFNRVLIICPNTVKDVWVSQARKWKFPLAVLKTGGSVKEKAKQVKLYLGYHQGLMVVTNYEAFWRDKLLKVLLETEWDLVVYDEIHRLKSPHGKASKAAGYQLVSKAKRVVGLTGTLIPHSYLDIFAQMRAVDPSIFGIYYTRFKREYVVEDRWGGVQTFKNVDDLLKKVRQITMEISRDNLDLPDKVEIIRNFALSDEERSTYTDLEYYLVSRVQAGDKFIQTTAGIAKLMKLQQVCSGFAYHEEEGNREVLQIGTSKLDVLREILEDSKEPVVIFCNFQHEIDVIKALCKDLDRHAVELSGRAKELDRWEDVLVCQIKTGSLGIDLTKASLCIFYSLTFNWGDYEQALARIHRPGQQAKSVRYIYLLAKGTIEERILEALKSRTSTVEFAKQFLNELMEGK